MRRLLVAVVALVALASPARAQEYLFEVTSVLLEAFVEPDGTVSFDYTFDITNDPGAKTLDGVDVGLPTRQWSTDRAKAWLDGAEIGPVVKSPYVDNGLAANFPAGRLAPGEHGVVRVRVDGIGGLMFADTANEGTVSMRLTPTWFSSQFVKGQSFVRVVVHLPPGVPSSDAKWHAVPWIGQATVEASPERPEHAAVVFEKTYAFTGAWELGVSFPRHVPDGAGGLRASVAGIRDLTTWDLFSQWAASPPVRAKAMLGFLAAFTLLFFWATRRTGCVVWGISCVGLIIAFAAVPVLPILLAPALPVAAFLVRSLRLRRASKYVPAVASVEGGGIKRGLTAPEAACLLAVPPGKILVLVLYGLSRKGLVELQDDGKSLKAVAAKGFGASPGEDLALAADKGSVVHPYESAFLAILHGAVPKDVASLDWKAALQGVAQHAASRLQGYDLEQTKDYYRKIVARAWTEASTVGDVAMRQESVDRNFDWMVLDNDAWKRMDRWHRSGFRYRNPWFPVPGATTAGTGRTTTAGAPPSSPPPLPGTPSAKDVAGSLGGRLEGLSGSLASVLGVGSAAKGVFSGVDRVSSEAFKSIVTEMAKSSSSRGGGGGGGGGGFSCACACAGCACACACAGGGR